MVRCASDNLVGCAVVVLGSCNDAGQVAAPLRAPGYLDHNIALPAPGAQERSSMLASHLSARGAQYDFQHLQVASHLLCCLGLMSYCRCSPPDLVLLSQSLSAAVLSNIWKMLSVSAFKGHV